MKKIILAAEAALILLLAVPFVTRADDMARQFVTPDAALGSNVAEQIAVLASFAVVDYQQSVAMFYESNGYYELNPLLGTSPGRVELISFGVVGVGLVYFAVEMLPEGWRQVVMDSIVATERLNIEDNRTVYEGWNTEGPPLRGRTMDNGIPIMVSLRF